MTVDISRTNSDKGLELDTKLLADLIYELNIARRHLTSYPKGHPLVNASIGKVTALLDEVFSVCDEVTLGVAKDILMVGSEFLDRGNPVFRDLAGSLFTHGVVMLSIAKGLRPEELYLFNEIVARRPQEVVEQGGFEKLLVQSGVTNIRVKIIDYSLFSIREGEQVLPVQDNIGERRADALWQGFVGGLFEGTLNPSGNPSTASIRMDPELVAELLNEQSDAPEKGETESYERTITNYMRKLDREEILRNTELMERLSRLIRSLNPSMRRHFLKGSFRALADRREIAESVLKKFPDEAIIEALEHGIAGDAYVPPFILGILQRLSGSKALNVSTNPPEVPDILSHEDIVVKLGLIFREDELDEFVPPDYRGTLERAASAEAVLSVTDSEAAELAETLSSHHVEVDLAKIIIELAKTDKAGETTEALKRLLRDECSYFLQVGDFQTLLEIHANLRSSEGNGGHCKQLRAIFSEPEFIEALLEAPRIWGKTRHVEIGWLVEEMGTPLIEPMLDRLEVEDSLSMRRFYVNELTALGPMMREKALARLDNRRWYFVRNLLVILRHLGDPSVLPSLSMLFDHPHPKVRQELARTLMHFGDPAGDRLVMQDLKAPGLEKRLAALGVAGRSRSPEVLHNLIGLLGEGGLSGSNLGLRKAAIQALAEIGDAAAVPALESLLRSRNLIYSTALLELKIEALKSLHRYPAAAVRPILREMAGSGQGKVSVQAAETLKNLRQSNQ